MQELVMVKKGTSASAAIRGAELVGALFMEWWCKQFTLLTLELIYEL